MPTHVGFAHGLAADEIEITPRGNQNVLIRQSHKSCSCSIPLWKDPVLSTRYTFTDQIGFGIWGLAAHAAPLHVLSQQLEQDLSAGQRDVGAFEANIWGRTLGDPRGEEIINVCDNTRSVRSARNAACVGGMGRHDFIDRYR
jgi:hypothetical protein